MFRYFNFQKFISNVRIDGMEISILDLRSFIIHQTYLKYTHLRPPLVRLFHLSVQMVRHFNFRVSVCAKCTHTHPYHHLWLFDFQCTISPNQTIERNICCVHSHIYKCLWLNHECRSVCEFNAQYVCTLRMYILFAFYYYMCLCASIAFISKCVYVVCVCMHECMPHSDWKECMGKENTMENIHKFSLLLRFPRCCWVDALSIALTLGLAALQMVNIYIIFQ